jgi:rhodanese-related sulfurtransferase
LTPRQALARQIRGDRVVFLDARPADRRARTSCRIPGAIRMDDAAVARERVALPADAVLVAYGDHGLSREPEALAELLRLRGFHEVRVLAGGFAGWCDLRYPTELAIVRSRPRDAARRARPALRLVRDVRP